MYYLNDVSKLYTTIRALDNISLEIPTDKFVVILGPSGCGKSTLLRLLSFIEKPELGIVRLEINGKTYSSGEQVRPWPIVTCVFQKQFLWPHLTLRENIELPLRQDSGIAISCKIDELVNLFNMSSFIGRYPNEVSGGQAQRVALARAFALNPKLMLIDEAHGGLDLEQQHILNSHLVLLKQTGVGLIVVTHSLEFAQTYADHIVILEKGEIVEYGPQSIFKYPKSRFLKLAMSNLDG